MSKKQIGIVVAVITAMLAVIAAIWPDLGSKLAHKECPPVKECPPIPAECLVMTCENACIGNGYMVDCLYEHQRAVCIDTDGEYKIVEIDK